MTKLAFIVTDAISFNRLMAGQLEFIAAKGISITLFCGGIGQEVQRLRDRGVGKVVHVRLTRRPHPFWDLVALIQLTYFLSVGGFDGLIYSTPKAMLLGALAGFFTRTPKRTALVRGRIYENAKGSLRRSYILLDRIAFCLSHQVVFISRSLCAAYQQDGIELGNKGKVLGWGSSNGVDLNRFRPPRADERRALRRQAGIAVDAFVIALVGRVTADKGFGDATALMERLSEHRDIVWVVVGPIEDMDLLARISDAAAECALIVGATDHVENWFKLADLHLFLSSREGFGNVAIEAAATGLPTFAYDVVGVKDSVVSNLTGELFLRERGVNLIAERIVSAKRDLGSFAKKFCRSREVVASRFNQNMVWDLYLNAYLAIEVDPVNGEM